jgi:RPA family protein
MAVTEHGQKTSKTGSFPTRIPAVPVLIGELLKPVGRLPGEGPAGIITRFGRRLRRVRLYGMITELWTAENGTVFFRLADLTGGITLGSSRYHPRVEQRLKPLLDKPERFPTVMPSVVVITRLVPQMEQDKEGNEILKVKAYAEELRYISAEERMAWLSETALSTARHLEKPGSAAQDMFRDLLLSYDMDIDLERGSGPEFLG